MGAGRSCLQGVGQEGQRDGAPGVCCGRGLGKWVGRVAFPALEECLGTRGFWRNDQL